MKCRQYAIVLLAVLLISCTAPTSQINYNFKQGNGELQVKLLDRAPPPKIYPNSNFKMIVEVDNQAAYDTTAGQVRVVGLDEKYFQLYPTEQTFETLVGKSLTSPTGDKTHLEFDGTAGQLFENAEEYVGNFFLKVQYRSMMEFAETVCINPNLYAVYDSGCQVQDKKSFAGQGAPLAIVSLEEITYPSPEGAVEFRLMLANRGRGKVGQVNLGRAQVGNDPMSCEFQNVGGDKKSIQFTEEKQEATLICKKSLADQNSYTTTLALDFSYNYELKQLQRLTMIR